MAVTHEIKILKPYFEAVLSGAKTFEIRRDDRGYQKGDKVVLNEFDEDDRLKYNVRKLMATIGYVTAYEQQPGYVVFSLLKIQPKNL